MPTSSVFKATSFSLALAAVFILEGCGASGETELYQCYYTYETSKSSLPGFEARLFYSPDSAGQRLDVYVSVKESRLKYERQGDIYRASYISSVRLVQKEQVPITKEVSRVIKRNSYPEDLDNSYDAFLVSFNVKPGEYSVEVSVNDEESKQKAVRIYDLTVPDISDKKLALSDILLLARYDTSGQSRKITPFIMSNAGLLPDTIKFFTVVSSKNPSVDSIFFYLYKLRSRDYYFPNFSVQTFSNQPSTYDPCSEKKDTVLIYSYWTTASLNRGNSFVFGVVPKPPVGNYLLKVAAKDESKDSAMALLDFQVRTKNFPDISDDLPEMVSSLNYIASSYELKKIVEAKTDSAVKGNLLKFWKDRGGYDKMVQYYHRVAQANQYFANCVDGWKTPMGMFYIVCGPPDYVECQGAWNEKWVYSEPSTQSSMMVVFRLTRETINPDDRFYRIDRVYSNADMWGYYVNKWRTSY
ncbi:MAG: GWxTD domain-containing protein [Bacteroidetes bacterium]|nr:GWxTD domain-containing protein [Bacteroidota bacterium]MCL5739250.1 GWxTD domain-containing protein [Bacteroidota bacterium]